MASSNTVTTAKADEFIYETYQKSLEIITGGRCAYINAIAEYDVESKSDDYSKQVLARYWNIKGINQPLVIEIFYFNPNAQRIEMIEKWSFHYQRSNDDPLENRISLLQIKIITHLRTLYSIIRLLPSFQLLNVRETMGFIKYRVYNPDQRQHSSFNQEFSTHLYEFPRLSTSKGILRSSVNYVDGIVLQDLFRTNIHFLLRPVKSQRSSSVHSRRSSGNQDKNLMNNAETSLGTIDSFPSQESALLNKNSGSVSGRSTLTFAGSSSRSGLNYDSNNVSISSSPPGTVRQTRILPIRNNDNFPGSSKRSSFSESVSSISPYAPTFLFNPSDPIEMNRTPHKDIITNVDSNLSKIRQNYEEIESSNIPQLPSYSPSLASTPPQYGQSLSDRINNARGSGSQMLLSKNVSFRESNFVGIPSSPFESSGLSYQIDGNPNNRIDIEEKSMNRFIKEIIYRNRNGLSLLSISNADDDIDTDDDDLGDFGNKKLTMAFASASTADLNEGFPNVTPLRTLAWKQPVTKPSGTIPPLDGISMDIKEFEDIREKLMQSIK